VAGEITGLGGTLLIFGIHGDKRPMPLADFYVKEVTIVHPRGATGLDYQRAIELVATELLDLSAVRTARYPLGDAVAAFDAARTTNEIVKFVLEP
jgi:threonine dehydrogenase-like Zn-dependent dehydrogenase